MSINNECLPMSAVTSSAPRHNIDALDMLDFDTLLTDLPFDDQLYATPGVNEEPLAPLATPWLPALCYDDSQFINGGGYSQLLDSSEDNSHAEPSTSHTDTSESQGRSQPATVSRLTHTRSKVAKGSGKRSEAWILKNRRAQAKFRAKQKVRSNQALHHRL